MKKILLLGGSSQQIIAIETAKRLGLYTILCDYLEDNPGQYYADRFYPVSTTDRDAVLKIARKEQIDYILAYASDPAVPVAAYVADQMKLPGSPYSSIQILSSKEAFREFQRKHGFSAPMSRGYSDIREALGEIQGGRFRFPVIVKPVDSSGSKGVGSILDASEAEEKLQRAMQFSRAGRIIAEEKVGTFGRQLTGEGLSVDGKLLFVCFADQHYEQDSGNPFCPVSASYPCRVPDLVMKDVMAELQRLITLLDMGTAVYNFEVRIGEGNQVYLMEAAPRSGGNFIPEVIQYISGLDLVECSVKAAMGEKIHLPVSVKPEGCYSYYVVHSKEDGILDRVEIAPEVREKNLLAEHVILQPGDKVSAFTAANKSIEVLVMKFEDLEQMNHMVDHPEEWLHVYLKNS